MRISDWSSDVCSSDLTKIGLRDDNGCKLLRGNREIVAAPANLDRDRVAFVDESADTVVGDVDEDFCLLAEISDIAQFHLASSAASLERLKRALRRNGCYRDAVGVAAVTPDRRSVVGPDSRLAGRRGGK